MGLKTSLKRGAIERAVGNDRGWPVIIQFESRTGPFCILEKLQCLTLKSTLKKVGQEISESRLLMHLFK